MTAVHAPSSVSSTVAGPAPDTEEVLLLSARTVDDLAARLDEPGRPGPLVDGPRVAVLDPTPQRLAVARKIVAAGKQWRGRRDVWFSQQPMLAAGGRVAFVFPGLEADFTPRVDDVAGLLGIPVPALSSQTMGRHAASVFAVGELLDAALRRIGVPPDAVAGHSAGEWQAMRAGGIVAKDDFDRMIERAQLDALVVPGVEFAVLGCSAERARALLGPGLVISHDNAPHQTVVCGPAQEVEAVVGLLRADGVICQPLPFRSGFHTPMLESYLGPFQQYGLPSLPMRPWSTPVWSATLARPFPADPVDIRALSVRQLLEPVRFRELVLGMHDAGVRVFVQAGTGQLGSLIEDTLRGTDHLCVVANSPLRTGIAQLRRVAAAVWVEGGTPDFAALQPRPVDLTAVDRPWAAELQALMDDMTAAVDDVIRAATVAPAQPGPSSVDRVLEISTETMPYLRDHRLSLQRDDWPDETDRRPVVPATTMIALMLEAAEAAAPGRFAVEISDVRFRTWLVAAPARQVEVSVRPIDGDRVAVWLGEFAEATVTLAARHQPATEPARSPSPAEQPPDITPAQVYADRWMFHGPTLQGITGYTGISEGSISGKLRVTEPPGSLLDNFGQLLGLWMTQRHRDRPVAFPATVERIVFHEPQPEPGRTVDAALRVTSLSDEWVTADGQVSSGGRPLITVTGWKDYRVEGDWTSCTMHRFPDRSTLAERMRGGPWLLFDPWRSLTAREFYLAKYLGATERADYLALPPPQRWPWLAGRIVIKDAVRGYLWDRGHGPVFPAELQVWQDTFGDNRVTGMHGLALPELQVATSRAGSVTVALVRPGGGGPCVIEVDEVVEASLRVHKAVSRGDEELLDRQRRQTGDALPVALARLAVSRSVSAAASTDAVQTDLVRKQERQFVVAWTAATSATSTAARRNP
ncbi:MAG: acyltransferase domain-containing protein [Thermocrispum sp.]